MRRTIPTRKKFLLTSYRQLLAENRVVLALHNSTLLRDEDSALRASLRGAGARLTVTRAGLMRAAARLENVAPQGDTHFADVFEGATAVVSMRELDPPALSAVVQLVDKMQPRLVLLAAAVDGRLAFRRDVDAIKSLPPLPQLRAQLLGLLQHAGGQALAATLQQPAQTLAQTLAARE